MTEAEFRAYAKAEGYAEPEDKTQPADAFYDLHAHPLDLLVFMRDGRFTVDYGDRAESIGAGEMCAVPKRVDHTDAFGAGQNDYLIAWR